MSPIDVILPKHRLTVSVVPVRGGTYWQASVDGTDISALVKRSSGKNVALHALNLKFKKRFHREVCTSEVYNLRAKEGLYFLEYTVFNP
jgi:hypothetical protein